MKKSPRYIKTFLFEVRIRKQALWLSVLFAFLDLVTPLHLVWWSVDFALLSALFCLHDIADQRASSTIVNGNVVMNTHTTEPPVTVTEFDAKT